MLGERHAPVVLALLGAAAAAAGAAAAPVLGGRLRLSAAITAPLGRGRLRGRAGAAARALGVLRTANGRAFAFGAKGTSRPNSDGTSP
jgi:hypothetical protein